MSQRFSYVKYDDKAVKDQQDIKALFEVLEETCNKRLERSRELSLVMTKLEEAYMWTGKAIRDAQIVRDGQYEEQVERSAE